MRIITLTAFASLICASAPAFAKSSNEQGDVILAIVVIAILLIAAVIFIMPTIVAFYRGHPNRWVIMLINVVFGATLLGWLASLIWALHGVHRPKEGSAGGQSGLNLFVNDEKRVRITHGDGAGDLDAVREMNKIKALYEAGHIDVSEYESLRRSVLAKLI